VSKTRFFNFEEASDFAMTGLVIGNHYHNRDLLY